MDGEGQVSCSSLISLQDARISHMKTCIKCGEEKSEDSFSWKQKDVRRSNSCKECHKNYRREHYKLNREKYRKQTQSRDRPYHRHRLSLEEYVALLEAQGNKCSICFEPNPTHIDHDHSCCPGHYSCGKCVRGVLCGHCNRMLGCAKDDVAVLAEGIRYLNAYKERV